MIKNHLRLLVAVLMTTASLQAQHSLGLLNLGPKINSRYDEVRPIYSPDGMTLYFSRINHPENKYGKQNTQEIWTYEIVKEGVWTEPKRFDALNTGTFNAVLGVSSNGQKILLNGVYNSTATAIIRKGISIATWNPKFETWSTPKEVEIKSMKWKADIVTAWMNPEANRIIFGTGAGPEDNTGDLVMTEKKGNEWSRPVELKGLNSKMSDFSPTLTADGHNIYFVSNREAGTYKIFKASRMDTTSWHNWTLAAPVEANKFIKNWQPFITVHPLGKWVLICSADKSLGRSDIFKLYLRTEKVQHVAGLVPEENGRPIDGSLLKLFANGVLVDSVKFEPDGTYVAYLPEGKEYDITFQQKTRKWGGRDVIEENIKGNRGVVTLKGKVADKDGQPYPAGSYRLLANGVTVNDALVEANGSFALHLPLLKNKTDKYTISAAFSDGHTRIIPVIDEVSAATAVVVSKDKEVKVRGTLFDGDTGVPLWQSVIVKLPGNPNVPATFDGAGGYQISLAGGQKHLVSFYSPDYLPGSVYVDTQYAPESGTISLEKIILHPLHAGQVVELGNVYFVNATLRQESYIQLDEVARYFDAIPNLVAEVISHTDNTRDAYTAKVLSQKRATAVTDYLISKGVLKTHLKAVGMGSEKPVTSNNTHEGRQLNNRVEFVVREK